MHVGTAGAGEVHGPAQVLGQVVGCEPQITALIPSEAVHPDHVDVITHEVDLRRHGDVAIADVLGIHGHLPLIGAAEVEEAEVQVSLSVRQAV